MSRRLEVSVHPADEARQVILLPTLVRTLAALQKLSLQVGEMLVSPGPPRTHGEFTSAVRACCEFEVRDLRRGSLTVELELRPPPPQPSLFEPDLGARALETILRLTEEVTNGASPDTVQRILPSESHRCRILRTYKSLCPTASDHAHTVLADPESANGRYTIDRRTRPAVQLLIVEPNPHDIVEERQLIGRLTMLCSDPRPVFRVKQEAGSYNCPYDDELKEQLLEMYDATVVVRALCRVVKHDDGEDEILDLCDIGDISFADLSPLVVSHIQTASGESIDLLAPMSVTPELSENLFVFRYPELGVVGAGQTREEAEAAFRDELAWLWATYAGRPDAELTEDAVTLRDGLLGLARGGVP